VVNVFPPALAAAAYHCDLLISLCHLSRGEQKGYNLLREDWRMSLAILAALSASIALADDFKTIDGKEYKNVTVNRVEPDGLVLKSKSGISKVYFTELPKEVQERFHYDAQQAAQFTSQTVEQNRLAQERKVEEDEKRAEEIAKRRAEQEVLPQQRDAEMRRQQREAEQQPQQRIRRAPASTPSVSQEGIREHTYEILQDHIILVGNLRIRLHRGEQHHGRNSG
jgi:hypothetical protein